MSGRSPRDARRRRKPLDMREAALRVVRELRRADHVALFNGGCVRDMLMGNEPHDYDVATSAHPEEVIRLFRRTQQVGAKFGVILVRVGRHVIEVATFRTDLPYEDGRRPTGVEYAEPEEDARRRDFTINGMFFDPVREEVVDYVGGQADLEARLVRAIGAPEERFAEDHLRLLRAVRFAARFGFEIEPLTWSAMQHHAAEIRQISPERVRMELEAMLTDPNRTRAVELLHDAGILLHLWPDAAAICDNVQPILAILAALPATASFALALAAMLSTRSACQVAECCTSLRCSNATQATTRWLVERQDALAEPEALTLADLKLLMARAAFPDLMALCHAKLIAAGQDTGPYQAIVTRTQAVPADEIAPPPLLTGHDLADLGLPQGPQYKTILDRVYYAQLNDEIETRDEALAMARELQEESR